MAESIWDSVSASIWQYVDDISGLYSVSIFTYSGNDPVVVRNRLIAEYNNNPSLIGCVFVGDIPAAFYEIEAHDGWSYESFPCDLFYMDLNGMWEDSDGDRIYDQHSGNTVPEIWVGRLKASTMTIGDEVSLINNYFDKNHMYRIDLLSVPKRALAYVDDDWIPSADGDKSALQLVYSDTMLIKDGATTTASDYMSRLAQGYEWVHLRCHGSPTGHTFKIGSEWDGRVSSSDYISNDFPVLFYQLFVCSAARYTHSDYLAGAIIFSDTHGLLAVGSTKTGSMLYFDDFYRPISEGKSVGAAFKEWFIAHGTSNPDWFYGLTIIGDPTLEVQQRGEK